MCKFLYSFNNAKFALLNQLNIDKTSPLDNNGFFYINRKRPNDEDLEDEATDLDKRHSADPNLRREAQNLIRDTYGINSDTAQGERDCQRVEKVLEREYKKRRLERDEFNDKPGVNNAGCSPSASPISEDSDHRQLMEDERDYLERHATQYRQANSHRDDYSEADAVEYARNSLASLKDEMDNPDTDSTETASEDERTSEPDTEDDSDNPDTGHTETANEDERTSESDTEDDSDNSDTGHTETANEDERTSEPDTEDESSDLSNGSDKGTNIGSKIKDIFKGGKGGGSGSVSSGGSGEEGSNNNGGSDSGSNDFSILHKFFFIFLYIIGNIAEVLEQVAELLGHIFL
uniref:Uncharacterized protein n=1 Tax=Annulohypoxylon stygium TaxID=326628 RepID=A0A386RXB4_9PEZI|nr:hypothetical protein [Annulohypoxylon stygium]AYE67643.1 hypothetical protein [Annulohypoxylon stygium]